MSPEVQRSASAQVSSDCSNMHLQRFPHQVKCHTDLTRTRISSTIPFKVLVKSGFVQSDPVQKTPVHERSPNVKFGQVKLPYTMQCVQRVHSLLLASSLRPVRVYCSQQLRYGALATTASGAEAAACHLEMPTSAHW